MTTIEFFPNIKLVTNLLSVVLLVALSTATIGITIQALAFLFPGRRN